MNYIKSFNTVADYESADLTGVIIALIKETGDVIYTNQDTNLGVSYNELIDILNNPV